MKNKRLLTLLLLGIMNTTHASYDKKGLDQRRETRASEVQLLIDEAWVDDAGTRHIQQEIFDEVFNTIDHAETFIYLDLFLLNNYGYAPAEGLRPLSAELAERLIARKKAKPSIQIIFLSDPINTLYGSIDEPNFVAMQQAGIEVHWTDLNKLRDSNPIYSLPWRLIGKPIGTGPANTLPNPMGDGKISMRSLFKMLNFKANHRKVILTEKSLIIASANPHSASSAHWNCALKVDHAGLEQAWAVERAMLNLSGVKDLPEPDFAENPQPDGGKLTLLTEEAIRAFALEQIRKTQKGDGIELTMFYFSEAKLIQSLSQAKRRGVDVRIILDPNKDAFGRKKGGIPNRQTAYTLHTAGIPVRWANTTGEQCHTKMLYVERGDDAMLLLGSANYTRRNLKNYNGECDLAYETTTHNPVMKKAHETFARWWGNEKNKTYTQPYETFSDHSLRKRIRARLMENSGLSTF